MKNKKYGFTGKEKTVFGRTLKQIVCITASAPITVGEVGGWIESEKNLSQVSGNAWVYGNAQVYGNARVSGDAWVYGNARVSGDAWVYGNARVSGDAWVYGDARVSGDAWVYGNASATKKVQTIESIHYIVTMTDNHIKIGCQQKLITEWEVATPEDVELLEEGAGVLWEKYGKFILMMAKDSK